MDTVDLTSAIVEARARTFELISDLSDAQLQVPYLEIVNPFLWEVGHVAWFQEKFVLRDLDGRPALRADGDSLFDSIAIAHETRWGLPVPPRDQVLRYMAEVRDGVAGRIKADLPREDWYRNWLAVFHEDMHDEAFTYMRQTLGYGPPPLTVPHDPAPEAGPLPGDVEVPAGEFTLGATDPGAFAFDNEVPAHRASVSAFRIARACVTQAEFAAFCDAGGYVHDEFWSEAGRQWRAKTGATCPVYWRRQSGRWQRRHFDQWRDLEPHRPVIHVCWYEAEAYCRWAGRRLPTEPEWEAAAKCEGAGGRLVDARRKFPWGSEPVMPKRANFDWRAMDTVDVGALPQGDSAFGCRQMLGNLWQWTASVFAPYPGFTPGPYKEYSEPVFHTRRVLRGGCWASRSRLLWNTWRNFFEPHRRDVFAGFRTCALE